LEKQNKRLAQEIAVQRAVSQTKESHTDAKEG